MNKIIKINPGKPETHLIAAAAEVVLKDGVIAYPTETIYGLGANAMSASAVERIFRLKGRESNKAILIIADSLERVESLVHELPDTAVRLAENFWPGPLTMVFKAAHLMHDHVSGTRKTIGVRIPSNLICLELLKYSGIPITSTSANRSGESNPISIGDVLESFGDELDLYIDGGKSQSDMASTVLDISCDPPVLRRQGKIDKKKIEALIGEVVNDNQV